MSNVDRIMDAVSKNNLPLVEILLDKGNINEFNYNFVTPLMMASRSGHYHIVKYLVEQGADIDLKSPDDGYSALLDSLSEKHENIALYLIENGADVDTVANDGMVPLMFAISNDLTLATKELIEKGCDLFIRTTEGVGALHGACTKGNVKITKMLLDRGLDANALTNINNPPLYLALNNGNPDVIELLINAGADLNYTGNNDIPLAKAACNIDNYALFQKILNKTKQIDYKTSKNLTALTHAAAKGKFEFVKALVEEGANININFDTDYSLTPLFQALENGNEKVAEYLYDIGAKLSDINLMNVALLMCAIENSFTNLTKKLIRDVNDEVINYYENDIKKKTIISHASLMGQLEIVGELVKRGADINAQDTDLKLNPLLAAVKTNHPKVVYFLLEMGAELKVTDLENNTPFDVAIEKQHDSVIKVIHEFIKKNNINPNDVCNKNTFN